MVFNCNDALMLIQITDILANHLYFYLFNESTHNCTFFQFKLNAKWFVFVCVFFFFLKSKAMGHIQGSFLLQPSYTNMLLHLPSRPPSILPSPPILIMQFFSLVLDGRQPWTNIVPYAGSSGGPYCVWRNGELTPMSEPSQWGHCVWIFLRLTQSHPTSLPCTGQARGCSGVHPHYNMKTCT